MRLVEVDTPALLKEFKNFPKLIYAGDPNFRQISGEYISILMSAVSAFRIRARARAYMGTDDNDNFICRFILLRDNQMPHRVVVCAFEAIPGLQGVGDFVMAAALYFQPSADSIVIGLNGHLNYGGGILLNHFEEPPLYDTNYNPSYYADYFSEYAPHYLSTFLFPLAKTIPLAQRFERTMSESGISVRCFNKRKAVEDVALYTRLNNICFADHFLWTERKKEEDEEMFFHIFDYLQSENILFAEKNGHAIGFLMWVPDFNKACSRRRASLPASLRWRDPAKASGRKCRLYELAVLPAYRNSPALPLLLTTFSRLAIDSGFTQCEGGFILESNTDSMLTAKRYIERMTGSVPEAYRRLALFYAQKGDPCWI
jgi:hypothetical protein